MKSKEYWKKRFLMLEDAENKEARQVNAYLEREHRKAEREIQAKINEWYNRFAVNNEISLAEARQWLKGNDLEEFKWDLQDYIKYGQENAINQQWMKQLENASAKFHISKYESLKIKTQQAVEVLRGNQLDAVDKFIRKLYTDDYYHTAFEIQKGFNIGWDIAAINEKQLQRVISKPWLADGKTFSKRIWDNTQGIIDEVHTQLTQNIMRGQPP